MCVCRSCGSADIHSFTLGSCALSGPINPLLSTRAAPHYLAALMSSLSLLSRASKEGEDRDYIPLRVRRGDVSRSDSCATLCGCKLSPAESRDGACHVHVDPKWLSAGYCTGVAAKDASGEVEEIFAEM